VTHWQYFGQLFAMVLAFYCFARLVALLLLPGLSLFGFQVLRHQRWPIFWLGWVATEVLTLYFGLLANLARSTSVSDTINGTGRLVVYGPHFKDWVLALFATSVATALGLLTVRKETPSAPWLENGA
jgi:hypothetical protein